MLFLAVVQDCVCSATVFVDSPHLPTTTGFDSKIAYKATKDPPRRQQTRLVVSPDIHPQLSS